MRRLVGLVLLLLVAPSCGGGPEDPQRYAPGIDAQAPIPPRTIIVDEAPRSEPGAGRVILVGYEPAELVDDKPAQGVSPAFFWLAPHVASPWPIRFDAPVPAGLALMAVRDVDGDQRPGPADRRSNAVVVPEVGEVLLLVDQEFLGGQGPAPMDPRNRRVGLLLQPEGVELTPRTLEVRSGSADRAVPLGLVMVVGYGAGGIVDGLPKPGTTPEYFFSGRHDATAWPIRLEVPFPTGLDLLIVLDVDGDALPSPPDLAAPPLVGWTLPGPEHPVAVVVERVFSPPDDEEDDGEEDDDEGDGNAAFFGLPEEVDGLEESAATGTTRTLVLDSRPRVPFLRKGTVMVAGYHDSRIVRGMPEEGARPAFFWRSEVLQLSWPLRIDAPLPSGMSTYLILDLDEDRMPSPGDLCSEVQPGYAPPPPGSEASFVFSKAFGLAEPDDVMGAD